ncbi:MULTISPECIES: hypothetical protein [Streptomyces]
MDVCTRAGAMCTSP